MAHHVDGPLYYERMGRTGPVIAFIHPNPMDQSCWIYQMARFSTWFRCVAIDIPGYGRSPTGTAQMSRFDMAQALSHEAAPDLVDAMTVSIEIVDSRWQQARDAGALLKLADLQSHGALVLGEWKPFAARDWARQTCVVSIGNLAPKSFHGSHSLGDPAWLLPIWLRHVTRNGATAPRGSVVTTGTWS